MAKSWRRESNGRGQRERATAKPLSRGGKFPTDPSARGNRHHHQVYVASLSVPRARGLKPRDSRVTAVMAHHALTALEEDGKDQSGCEREKPITIYATEEDMYSCAVHLYTYRQYELASLREWNNGHPLRWGLKLLFSNRGCTST